MSDETFADRLRARADLVVPAFDVDPERVVRRARTRRAVSRSVALTVTAAVVVVAGAWAAPGLGWDPFPRRGPAWSGAASWTDGAAPTPHATSTTSAAPTAPTTPTVPTYWYARTETTTSDGTHVRETWSSTERAGLWIDDGDLTAPGAFGPRDVLGRFRIDGQWVEMLRDPAVLPTSPAALAAVLYASIEPDRAQGTDDQKVFTRVHDLLMSGGTLPADLRLALWDVAAGLPGAAVADGEDSTGRSGRVLEYRAHEGDVRWVGDPSTGLLLERDEPSGRTVYVEQHATQEIPLEPTIEMAGCLTWETC